MTSDHYPIAINVHQKVKKCPYTSTHRINTKGINWDSYAQSIRSATDEKYPKENPTLFDNLSTEDKYKFVTDTLLNSLPIAENEKEKEVNTNPLSTHSPSPEISRAEAIKAKLKKKLTARPFEPP